MVQLIGQFKQMEGVCALCKHLHLNSVYMVILYRLCPKIQQRVCTALDLIRLSFAGRHSIIEVEPHTVSELPPKDQQARQKISFVQ